MNNRDGYSLSFDFKKCDEPYCLELTGDLADAFNYLLQKSHFSAATKAACFEQLNLQEKAPEPPPKYLDFRA